MRQRALVIVLLIFLATPLLADSYEPFTDSPVGKTVTGGGWLIADADGKSGFRVVARTDAGMRVLPATVSTNLNVQPLLGRRATITATIGEGQSLAIANISLRPRSIPEEVTQSVTLLAREGEKGKARFAALDAVRDSAPFVSEFVLLFPGAEVNYRYFTSANEPGFDVGVDLHERYEFRMQLPVRFDSEQRKVTGYGEPMFVIREAASVTRGPSGIARTRLNPTGERHFGSAEWRSLVARGGDFTAIGYTMITNQPVPGFAQRKVQP